MAADKNLIQGQLTMLEAGRDTSVSSFFGELTSQMKKIQEETQKEGAKIDAWLSKIGTPENVVKIEPGYRPIIDKWVKEKQAEFISISEQYEESQDPEDRQKLENIQLEFATLNDQLGRLALDKKAYAKAGGQQMLKLGVLGSEWYVGNYAKDDDSTGDVEGTFSVESSGKIFFGNDSFDSREGKWNVKNVTSTNNIKTRVSNAQKQALNDGRTGDKNFIWDNAYNAYKKDFDLTGAEGIMVLAQTDLVETDNNPMTFADQWNQGGLDESFYTEFPKNGGNDWMQKPENSDKLSAMMAKYLSNAEEDIYNNTWQGSFDKESNISFLDRPNKGLYVGATQSTVPRDQGVYLLESLKEGTGDFVFMGRRVTYDPINDVYTTQYGDEALRTYNGVEEFVSKMGITDPAFKNLVVKGRKKPSNNNDDDGGGGDEKPPKPKGIDRNYFKGPMTPERVLEIEKLYPGLKMTKGKGDNYILTFNGKNPVKIVTNRTDNFTGQRSLKSKNKFDNYINKYIK